MGATVTEYRLSIELQSGTSCKHYCRVFTTRKRVTGDGRDKPILVNRFKMVGLERITITMSHEVGVDRCCICVQELLLL